MDDLEYVVKQQEDDWDDDRQNVSFTKARDFRVDNLRQGRLKTKYPGRAYVPQSGDESDSDERHVMFEDETLEISPAQESVESREAPPEGQGPGMTMEELTQHVLKVMENSGWKKPGHMAHQAKPARVTATQDRHRRGMTTLTGTCVVPIAMESDIELRAAGQP
ncbi:hypothetical protein PHMEG_00041452 [Phytophthora megakarya]|uniref:Uncharacterized protein n=1 Tax=Phytophthora megakarya TaxID=4795 RepID=A0A225UBK4_9STRA|nr:hypothetical protein PHMEG_00041452 [Phytophthora megakarya]